MFYQKTKKNNIINKLALPPHPLKKLVQKQKTKTKKGKSNSKKIFKPLYSTLTISEC